MFQKISICTPSLRAGLRLQTLLLCLCLIVPLAWYEPGFGASASIDPARSAVISQVAHSAAAMRQDLTSHRRHASLAPAPSMTPSSGLRSSSRDDDPASDPPAMWIAASDVPALPSLRIDPTAWDTRTPSFLLPSAHGLVSFAIPPPLCLG